MSVAYAAQHFWPVIGSIANVVYFGRRIAARLAVWQRLVRQNSPSAERIAHENAAPYSTPSGWQWYGTARHSEVTNFPVYHYPGLPYR